MNDTKAQQSLATYVSDMIAVERHVLAPVESHNNDQEFAKYPNVTALTTKIRSMLQSHITTLETQLDRLGGHPAAGIKNAVATATGVVAGAIGQTRKTEVSKALRDDYVALGQIAISYTMLNATALGLRDTSLAQVAESNLNDVTPLIVEISRIMPTVVVNELTTEGLDVDTSVGAQSTSNTQEAWRAGATSAT